MIVKPLVSTKARELVELHHYMHRKPQVSYAFGLFLEKSIVGVVTYGTPSSRNLQQSVCPTDPSLVIELNRVWVSDEMPINTESWFISRTLKMISSVIVVSYADTAFGHMGYMYRALNFHYAGWTDMERKTPRYDYVPYKATSHSRDASRNGYSTRVQRKPKVKYWTVTGNRSDRRTLTKLVAWPSLDWYEYPPPVTHRYCKI
jgi:hypothetical protein